MSNIEEKKAEDSKNDVIEIPVGKFMTSLRSNPWMPATFVLGIILVFVLIFGGSGGVTGSVVSEDTAADNLLTFINNQGQGTAELVSVEKQSDSYNIVVKFNGEDIPVYVTLDGQYLITDKVPLTGGADIDSGDSEDVVEGKVENIDISDAPVLGSVSAPVTIVEFSDYECPFCGRHYTQTYSQLKKEYIDTGKVKLVFMDFPLSFHTNAQKAAEAARCFREQKGDSGYYKMHGKLFENQQTLSVENYKKWARELGADGAKFDKCLDDGKFAQAVKDDMAYGSQLGVSGTPGFFINGNRVSGAQPYSVFKQIIDQELGA